MYQLIDFKEKDFVWLVWKDPQSRQRFKIGELSKKDSMYCFKYDLEELEEARKYNFKLLHFFPDVNEEYCSERIFPAFLSRLPDRRRRDISVILNKYGLEKYEAYELLKKSGAKLPTDTFEFIEPIILDHRDDSIVRKFFIAGSRYYDLCDVNSCEAIIALSEGQRLKFFKDDENECDKFAVSIYTCSNEKIGYVPKFYSEAVYIAIERDYRIDCEVIGFYKDRNCEECVKVRLEIVIG